MLTLVNTVIERGAGLADNRAPDILFSMAVSTCVSMLDSIHHMTMIYTHKHTAGFLSMSCITDTDGAQASASSLLPLQLTETDEDAAHTHSDLETNHLKCNG